MVNTLDNIITDKQDIKNQIGSVPSVTPVIRRFSSPLIVKHKYNIIKTRDINASFIIGHPTQARRDVTLLDESYSPYEIIYVVPNNNTYTEYFAESEMINLSTSTGTLDTVNETYTIDALQVLQSNIIYKTDTEVINVKFNSGPSLGNLSLTFQLDISKLDIDPLSSPGNGFFEISNNNGATWKLVTSFAKNTVFTTPSTDGVIYRYSALENLELNGGEIEVVING